MKLQVPIESVERDYVLNGLLFVLAGRPRSLVFRGGTALARAYWPDHRLSEDLDFVSQASRGDILSALGQDVDEAAEVVAVALTMEVDVGRSDGFIQSFVRWGDEPHEVVKIDVNLNESAYLATEDRELSLPYRVFAGEQRHIPTVTLAEILGNKWYMLDDRREPRDLYDLWWALSPEGLDFSIVVAGHAARYRYPPMRQFLTGARRGLEELWSTRLEHQRAHLPEFQVAYEEVLGCYDRWKEQNEHEQA
ncbi:MAG: nucleotidyl transferase AbiEii/AbiGii toxin family protein [Actinomycetota bacterium]